MKQGGGANMRPSLLEAKLKLLNVTPCIILLKGQLHARRALSEREKRPWDKVGYNPQRGQAESQRRLKNLTEVQQKEVVKTGTGMGERKRRSSTAPAAGAREVL
eukprot:5700702-Pleurochrysis_carterae.AAC.2